ncbi:MAG: DUF4214 domain-containing protein [Cyanobacteria bacterium P01_D01_bin.73]
MKGNTMIGRSRQILLVGTAAISAVVLLMLAQVVRQRSALTARSVAEDSQHNHPQHNQLCVGNSLESLCLENGWNYGSVSGAWDEAEGVIASFSEGDIALVNYLYKEMLGRDADSEGLETYVEALQRGWSVDKIREEIANSHETRLLLQQLYQEIFNRDIDKAGLDTYRNLLQQGWGLRRVRKDLIASPEAKHFRGRL